MRKVAVIGGGITGLSTAYYLSKGGASVDVFEASDRLGGKIKTYRKDDFVIELGPESYISRKKELTELAIEIGMEEALVRNEIGQSYIYTKNALSKVPTGTMLGVPTTLSSIWNTDLLTSAGKIRSMMDYILPRVPVHKDISAGEFFERRLGKDVKENMIEPLLSGVYSTDIDEMSLLSTYPFFKEQEEEYGSLIRGMSARKKAASEPTTNKKQGLFYQFKDGLESFVERLASSARSESAILHTNSKVERIERVNDDYFVTVNHHREKFDDVVVATMHQAYKHLIDLKELEYFEHMKATTVANVVMAFNEEQVSNNLDGTGFVISRNAGTSITACTWTNKKWAHSAPKGKALLRAYIGKPNDKKLDKLIMNGTDEEILNKVRKDLDQVMNIEGEPEFFIVTRMPQAAPNYVVGHRAIIENIHKDINKNYPGLYFIGAPHYAVGLPDCVATAKKTAEEILKNIND